MTLLFVTNLGLEKTIHTALIPSSEIVHYLVTR